MAKLSGKTQAKLERSLVLEAEAREIEAAIFRVTQTLREALANLDAERYEIDDSVPESQEDEWYSERGARSVQYIRSARANGR
jgi:hypothetical protein